MQMVKDVQQDRKPRAFQLHFAFKGVPYSTIFKVHYELLGKTSYVIEIQNECILIHIEFYKSGNQLYSSIGRNVAEPACFSPRLQTSVEPVKITSVDVLQTLVTKLRILMHKLNFINKIELIDHAKIESVSMLPYRVMRGQPALYEKYGYESEKLNEFRATVLPTLNWDSYKKADSLGAHFDDKIFDKYNKDKFDDDWRLHNITELLVNIPFEEEAKKSISVSQGIMISFIEDTYSTSDIVKFTLNPESPKWKEWDRALEFVGFEELHTGGSKTRKHSRVSWKKLKA
jgi:hypothetical protein